MDGEEPVIEISTLLPLTMDDLLLAQERISGFVKRTPIVKFPEDGNTRTTLLKLESEQNGGSYKVRGALNAALSIPECERSRGLVTVSSGNMGRAVAWSARQLGVKATVGIPASAPDIKVQALRDLGADLVVLSPEQWWSCIVRSHLPGQAGAFISPVLNREVIAGAATVAWEVLADVSDPGAIYVPFGGGALALGTANAVALRGSNTAVIACEPSAKAPLTKSFLEGSEQTVDPEPSIVDAAGGPGLLPGLWPLFRSQIDQSQAVDDSSTRAVIRRLKVWNITTSEGAGAISVAAALERMNSQTATCIVTGGNIDRTLLDEVLAEDF